MSDIASAKENQTLVLSIYGTMDADYNVYCNETDTCIINCQSFDACERMLLCCLGDCIVNCDLAGGGGCTQPTEICDLTTAKPTTTKAETTAADPTTTQPTTTTTMETTSIETTTAVSTTTSGTATASTTSFTGDTIVIQVTIGGEFDPDLDPTYATTLFEDAISGILGEDYIFTSIIVNITSITSTQIEFIVTITNTDISSQQLIDVIDNNLEDAIINQDDENEFTTITSIQSTTVDNSDTQNGKNDGLSVLEISFIIVAVVIGLFIICGIIGYNYFCKSGKAIQNDNDSKDGTLTTANTGSTTEVQTQVHTQLQATQQTNNNEAEVPEPELPQMPKKIDRVVSNSDVNVNINNTNNDEYEDMYGSQTEQPTRTGDPVVTSGATKR